jgi:Reverse transcriptase (RNA-dependent DNA polymerase)
MNSIKSHYVFCKKKMVPKVVDNQPLAVLVGANKKTTQTATTTAKSSSESEGDDNDDHTRSQDNNNNMTRPTSPRSSQSMTSLSCANSSSETVKPNPTFDCEECAKQGIILSFVEKIKYVTHMRHKHPYAYEQSKTVAQKRIAWSKDEDRMLAGLEIKLIKSGKGRIVERLALEWKKLTKSTGTNARSLGAIKGRRGTAQYKSIIKKIMEEQESNTSSSSEDQDSESSGSEDSDQTQSVSQLTAAATGEIYEQQIREFIKSKLLDQHLHIFKATRELADAFVNRLDVGDYVEGAYKVIRQVVNDYYTEQKARTGPVRKYSEKPNVYNCIKSMRKKQKADEYKQHQRMYDKDRGKLVSVLLDGIDINTQPPPIKIATDHYANIWSKQVADSEPMIPKRIINEDSLKVPISWQEIEEAIGSTNAKTARGPDNITVTDLKRLLKSELILSFNIWLASRRIPQDLKMNRTVLIPKGSTNLDDIGNWRPITISSIIIRTYNKILGARLNKVLETSDKQLGFKPVNGCAHNIMWLNCLLKHARKNRNNLYACLLDVSKAFDSVPHHSIERALRRNNAPQMIIDIINDQYSKAFTSISYGDRSSKKIELMRGVKQGDPLSSLLFNLVIDELFDLIGDDYGYEVADGIRTNARCFADDLVLVSGSKIGMGELLSITTKFLKARGLNINPRKCVSIGLAKGFKGKKSKIETESTFQIDGVSVPMLGFTDKTTRYLGIAFSSLGAINSDQIWKYIKEVLEKIEKMRIKPQHKVDLMRSFIIPRFIYSLTHTEIYPKMLLQVDRYIRQTIRRILHLPISLSNEFFYLSIKDGGLQLANLHDLVGISRIKIYKSIKLSTDTVLKYLIESQGSFLHERYLHAMQLGGIQPSSEITHRKMQIMNERRAAFANKIHGVGFEIFSTSARTNTWLDGTFRGLSGKDYIQGIKLRTNSLETKVTCTRGLAVSKICSSCGKADESLMHLLQFCDGTRPMRYTRHHRLRHRVSDLLRKKGFIVYEEKTFHPTNNSSTHTRPDIVAIKANKAWILDVTCVYEISGASFINAAEQRKTRYQPIEEVVKQTYKCDSVETLGLTVGSRGSFFHGHLHIWKKLGFNSSELFYIAMNCMQDSIKICSVFRKNRHVNRLNKV